jgi:hypothetical protein
VYLIFVASYIYRGTLIGWLSLSPYFSLGVDNSFNASLATTCQNLGGVDGLDWLVGDGLAKRHVFTC